MVDFKDIIDRLKDTGYPAEPDKVFIKIPNAEQRLRGGLDYFTKGKSKWIERNYRPIVEWMEDNQGRGLLLSGGCGLGKSLIGMRILPLLINDTCRKIVSIYKAQELNTNPDEVINKHIIYIDDIGTESVSNIYGNKRIPFCELCDATEQQGKLLMCSSNLTIDELKEKYGERTIDRLRATTKYIPFYGDSLRK